MSRPTEPLELEYFEKRRVPAGDERLGLKLGPLEIGFEHVPAELAESMKSRYSIFCSDWVTRADALIVKLYVDEGVDYYIDPPKTPELNPVKIKIEDDRVRYLGYRIAGWFEVEGTEGEVLISGGDYEPLDRAFENYIRAAVAWKAAHLGGALVHAASAFYREAGYIFFGQSGAGKSTLAEANQRAEIVSDDLSLLLRDDDGVLQLIGSPFRGTYEGGEFTKKSYPLRAGFRLVQAKEASVEEVHRTRVLGELVGNLPFVAEEYRSRPDLFRSVMEAFEPIPLRHLKFAKGDDSYWDAIEAAGL